LQQNPDYIKSEPVVTLHGVLVQVFSTGVMFTGPAGIGKSECALELLTRGHQLIADDSVEIVRTGNRLLGRPPEMTRGLLYIRGFGCIDVARVFGDQSIRADSPIDLVVELTPWQTAEVSDTLFVDFVAEAILDVTVRKLNVLASPRRNLSLLAETAVRLLWLEENGEKDAASELIKRHQKAISLD